MSISLYLPETRYAVASLPLEHYGEAVACLREAEGFVSLTRDKEEITLVVAEEIWRRLAPRFPGAVAQEGRRLIRFDTVLDFSVVGFIAEISRALAEADDQHPEHFDLSHRRCSSPNRGSTTAVNAIKQALVTLKFTHLAQH